MYSQQNNQFDICVIKYDLEGLVDDLVIQNSAIPELDEDTERKYREVMGVVQKVRAINTEKDLQKEENDKLTAKRKQLQLSCEEITKSMNKAYETKNETENQLKQVEDKIELAIRAYEDSLREKADRFRKMNLVCNEVEMKEILDNLNENLRKLKAQEAKLQNENIELEKVLDSIGADIPENILDILGKTDLENILKALTDDCEEQRNILDRLQKEQKYRFIYKI